VIVQLKPFTAYCVELHTKSQGLRGEQLGYTITFSTKGL